MLTSEERRAIYPPVLPALVRFCKAFPPLLDDVVGLLLQYGRIVASESSLKSAEVTSQMVSPTKVLEANGHAPTQNGCHLMNGHDGLLNGSITKTKDIEAMIKSLPAEDVLTNQIRNTFTAILDNSVLEKRLY